MIRSLRRRHPWMLAVLFVIVVLGSILALMSSTPAPVMETLPPVIADGTSR